MSTTKANNIIGIIPARMGSSRFPGKPMAKIAGVPMIGHCYFRAKMSRTLNEVYVATCDQEIADYIRSVGGKAVMTADSHERASDRAAEAPGKGAGRGRLFRLEVLERVGPCRVRPGLGTSKKRGADDDGNR